MNSDPAKQAWQSSVEVAGAPPLEQVRAGAKKFYRYVFWRNAVEYVACVVVIVSFTYNLFTLPHPVQKLGSALIIAAALYTPWQLHRRASAEPPEKAGTMPIYSFVRAQLVRQRDALRDVFWWYILPFLPGFVLIIVGKALDPTSASVGPPLWVKWLVSIGIVSILIGVWWLNQHVARKMQNRIEEIDALTGGME